MPQIPKTHQMLLSSESDFFTAKQVAIANAPNDVIDSETQMMRPITATEKLKEAELIYQWMIRFEITN